MDSGSRKFLIIGGVAIVILIIVFIYILNKVLSPGDQQQKKVSPFPESGTLTDVLPGEVDNYVPFSSSSTDEYGTTTQEVNDENDLMDTVPDVLRNREAKDWRDPVVSFSNQEAGVVEPVTGTTGVASKPTNNYSKDDLFRDTELMIHYPDASEFYPKTVTLGDGTIMNLEDVFDFDKFRALTNPVTSLTGEFDKVQACGTLRLSEGDGGYVDIEAGLSRGRPGACMGDAVASNCSFAWMNVVSNDDFDMRIYVGEKDDGSCGFGSTFSDEYVSMCDLTEAMNLATGKKIDFESWMDEFKSNPGGTFAKLYTSKAQPTSVSSLGCNLYEI